MDSARRSLVASRPIVSARASTSTPVPAPCAGTRLRASASFGSSIFYSSSRTQRTAPRGTRSSSAVTS
eukprot:6902325-Prymnesium_polylepis.1